MSVKSWWFAACITTYEDGVKVKRRGFASPLTAWHYAQSEMKSDKILLDSDICFGVSCLSHRRCVDWEMKDRTRRTRT